MAKGRTTLSLKNENLAWLRDNAPTTYAMGELVDELIAERRQWKPVVQELQNQITRLARLLEQYPTRRL